ncbi:hypothetical protein [Spirosoma sp. KNUC1025]|uniref:hypothetical protein n=1 Tax=Spirosoma sp. KNUC1025 TaxID=2894082 RepID=UPI003862D97D|nr:hypothetical protein LN737_26470 [Spirosoma sp. KNUC1025]
MCKQFVRFFYRLNQAELTTTSFFAPTMPRTTSAFISSSLQVTASATPTDQATFDTFIRVSIHPINAVY